MPWLGHRTRLGGEDAAKRSVGPMGCTSLMPSSSPLQKCLTASPRTCGGASSPAAMTVSAPLASSRSWASLACPTPPSGQADPPLAAGRAPRHPENACESTMVLVRARMQIAPALPLKTGPLLCSCQPLRACHKGTAVLRHVIQDNVPDVAVKRVSVPPAPWDEGGDRAVWRSAGEPVRCHRNNWGRGCSRHWGVGSWCWIGPSQGFFGVRPGWWRGPVLTEGLFPPRIFI